MDRLHEISNDFQQSKILLTAAELRIFDHLRPAGARAAEIASRIGGTERGVAILLDALVAMGLLSKDAGRYRNVPELEPELTEGSPGELPAMLRHRNRMYRSWAFLEERILGRPIPLRERATLEEQEANEAFIRAMFHASGSKAAAIVGHIDLTGVRTIADLGGGPGHYLAEFVRRLPDGEPYLIDLPLTVEVSRRMALDSGLPRAFERVAWDFYHEPSPPSLPAFDLVFVSQVVHAESPEANRELLRRIHGLTAPGGRVVIHERLVDPDRTSPREAALFAVNMLAMTPGGRTYTEGEILAWGREAGFAPVSSERSDALSCLLELRK